MKPRNNNFFNMKIPRFLKRLVIIILYLILFCGAGFVIYSISKPEPTCFDGKKNQNETEMDCGGPCAPCDKKISVEDLAVEEKAFVYGGQGRYDVMAKIRNPNKIYGSPDFQYEFAIKDSAGNILSQKKGSSFILPMETKYIIENNLETQLIPQAVEIKIINPRWEEFLSFQEKPILSIYHKNYRLISSGTGFSEVYGLLRNESPFDFNSIKIKILLRDSRDELVALNTTEMKTVNSREERDFKLIWPYSFPGEVQKIEIEPEADIYNTQNFIKQYLPEKKFQQYK